MEMDCMLGVFLFCQRRDVYMKDCDQTRFIILVQLFQNSMDRLHWLRLFCLVTLWQLHVNVATIWLSYSCLWSLLLIFLTLAVIVRGRLSFFILSWLSLLYCKLQQFLYSIRKNMLNIPNSSLEQRHYLLKWLLKHPPTDVLTGTEQRTLYTYLNRGVLLWLWRRFRSPSDGNSTFNHVLSWTFQNSAFSIDPRIFYHLFSPINHKAIIDLHDAF